MGLEGEGAVAVDELPGTGAGPLTTLPWEALGMDLPNRDAQGHGLLESRGRRRALLALLAIVVFLIAAQVILPLIAVQRARDRIDRYGTINSLSVSAVPALKLLWGKMDSLHVKASRMHVPATQIGQLLWSARGSTDMELSSKQMRLLDENFTGGGLHLEDVEFHKQGAQLSGQATVSPADLRAALPAGFEIQPLSSSNGQVEVQASGAVLGLQASGSGLISAQEGRLVVQPSGIPFGALVKVTLFQDPHLFINGIAASSHNGGYKFTITASLR
ncbi:MAG TPA: hypothetical protein VID48_10400 [Solirubrobacteraceae bacterium]